MATSTQWRISITAQASDPPVGNVGTHEITMAASAGGPTLCTGGTATASSAGGANVASRAFDGILTNGWIAGVQALPAWIAYEFPTAVDIRQYTWMAINANQSPADWHLQYWDGAAWVTADSQTGQTAWTTNEIRTFTLPLAASSRRSGFGAQKPTRRHRIRP